MLPPVMAAASVRVFMRFFLMARVDVAMGTVFARGMFMVVALMSRPVDVLMLVLMAMGVFMIVDVRMAVSNIPMAVNMVVFVMMSMHMLMGMRMFTFHFPILLMLYYSAFFSLLLPVRKLNQAVAAPDCLKRQKTETLQQSNGFSHLFACLCLAFNLKRTKAR